ncbi:hypothetical protein [Actibacterium sp. D379-3]
MNDLTRAATGWWRDIRIFVNGECRAPRRGFDRLIDRIEGRT